MDLAKLRAWWFARQGLDGSLKGLSAAATLEKAGWARSVGGANPYLAVFARTGASQASIDAEVADVQIHELPSVRSCTYVVPQAHYSLALTLARGKGEPAEVAIAKKHLGVTDAEIQILREKVLQSLESGPLDPREMKAPLGDTVRSLGDEGKKRGIGTTLPMVLGMLQNEGLIRRIPTNGRLDNQRFRYALWSPSPFERAKPDFEEACAEFARLYFKWIGPASRSAFSGLSGLGVAASQAAIAPLGLVPLEEGTDLLCTPADRDAYAAFQPPKDPIYVLASNLDNHTHLRWGQLQVLVDESDRDRRTFGPKGQGALGSLSELESHAIYDRGRMIGLWEFDHEKSEVVWTSFIEPNEDLHAAVRKMEEFGRSQLGDIRSFSLDSPESRRPRIEAIRSS